MAILTYNGKIFAPGQIAASASACNCCGPSPGPNSPSTCTPCPTGNPSTLILTCNVAPSSVGVACYNVTVPLSLYGACEYIGTVPACSYTTTDFFCCVGCTNSTVPGLTASFTVVLRYLPRFPIDGNFGCAWYLYVPGNPFGQPKPTSSGSVTDPRGLYIDCNGLIHNTPDPTSGGISNATVS